MAFFILPLLSARDLDISRGLITRTIWKRPCINLFITYFARADNMILPFTRGQITCYCPRKMLLPRRQIIRQKLCFYYTCKFGVISIKYVIIKFKQWWSIVPPISTNEQLHLISNHWTQKDHYIYGVQNPGTCWGRHKNVGMIIGSPTAMQI